jgi:hypothetical protein
VNFRPLSLFAASRTRSSALGAPTFRLCVRDAFCWSVFPLAGLLPSTVSAAAFAALFDGFVGTTSPSDFCGPFIVGLRLMAFPTRPVAFSLRAARRSPGSRADRFRTCTGSSTAQDSAASCGSDAADVAFRVRQRRRRPGSAFRGSIPGPHLPLSTLRRRPHGRQCMTRGRRGSLLLRRETLPFSPVCRFIPAHCLRHIVPLGERHLRAVLREFVEHYHAERNHQGLGNVVPFPSPDSVAAVGRVERRQRLGGVLNFYERKAA